MSKDGDADNPDIVGECCRWMRMALTATKGSPFCIEDGLIDVALGQVGEKDDLIFKSVLFCPFCGIKIPYPEKRAEVH